MRGIGNEIRKREREKEIYICQKFENRDKGVKFSEVPIKKNKT